MKTYTNEFGTRVTDFGYEWDDGKSSYQLKVFHDPEKTVFVGVMERACDTDWGTQIIGTSQRSMTAAAIEVRDILRSKEVA
jgi:hypothetical protein